MERLSPNKDELDLDVLVGGFSYGGLDNFKGTLQDLFKSIERVREFAQDMGNLSLAIDYEKELIILNRNIALVDVALSIKESELCESGTFDDMWLN